MDCQVRHHGRHASVLCCCLAALLRVKSNQLELNAANGHPHIESYQPPPVQVHIMYV